MDKLTLQSKNRTQEHVEKIAQLFPNVVTEAVDERGQLKRAIDFELLKQELSDTGCRRGKRTVSIDMARKEKSDSPCQHADGQNVKTGESGQRGLGTHTKRVHRRRQLGSVEVVARGVLEQGQMHLHRSPVQHGQRLYL